MTLDTIAIRAAAGAYRQAHDSAAKMWTTRKPGTDWRPCFRAERHAAEKLLGLILAAADTAIQQDAGNSTPGT